MLIDNEPLMGAQKLSARITTPANLNPVEIATWEALSASVPSLASPFLSFHYARAVAAAGIDVRICAIYKNKEICGFLPFQFRDRFSALDENCRTGWRQK